MKHITILILSLITLLYSGCTIYQPQHNNEPILRCPETKVFTTEVISEPPGAVIELDNGYIGKTPTLITWEGTEFKTHKKNHVLKAIPTIAGEYEQTKFFYGTIWPPKGGDPMPDIIYFNMYMAPVNTDINLNINNH